ncbi:MAG: PHP domain-containing protein [Xanthomonadaceae bacterium]|nr:PHP domain-containing protein [Xanthomonadaceae bacterium]
MAAIDLHSHSTASDGALAPAELVSRAHAQAVRVLALTDHDTTAGLAEAAQAAARHGIALVPGIELSAQWKGRELHVVGLGIDPEAQPLQALIAELAALRADRAERMAASLARVGYDDALEGAYAQADGGVPTRTHFARYLVERGAAEHVGAVFKRFLVRGRPGYANTEWPDLERAVAALRAAGGLAVLAHPHAYKWTGAWARRIIEAFVAAGGEGIEVACGTSTPQSIQQWSGYVRRYGLLASVGSDFHAPGQFVELGRMPALPQELPPIWPRLGIELA